MLCSCVQDYKVEKIQRERVHDHNKNDERFVKVMMKLCFDYSEGNPFAQGQQDGVTLADRMKYYSVALQFIPADRSTNLVVCIGVVPAVKGANDSGSGSVKNTIPVIEKLCMEQTGYTWQQLCHSTMVDIAALAFSAGMKHEKQGSQMHSGNKIGTSAVGDLVRTRGKVPENPFAAAQLVVHKAKAICNYFAYGAPLQGLWEMTARVHGPRSKPISQERNAS
jgi:hypothetical protein